MFGLRNAAAAWLLLCGTAAGWNEPWWATVGAPQHYGADVEVWVGYSVCNVTNNSLTNGTLVLNSNPKYLTTNSWGMVVTNDPRIKTNFVSAITNIAYCMPYSNSLTPYPDTVTLPQKDLLALDLWRAIEARRAYVGGNPVEMHFLRTGSGGYGQQDKNGNLQKAKRWITANVTNFVDKTYMTDESTLANWYAGKTWVWGSRTETWCDGTNLVDGGSNLWRFVRRTEPPRLSSARLLELMGASAPWLAETETTTGAVAGWRSGNLGVLLAEGVVTVTNYYRTWLDVTPWRDQVGPGSAASNIDYYYYYPYLHVDLMAPGYTLEDYGYKNVRLAMTNLSWVSVPMALAGQPSYGYVKWVHHSATGAIWLPEVYRTNSPCAWISEVYSISPPLAATYADYLGDSTAKKGQEFYASASHAPFWLCEQTHYSWHVCTIQSGSTKYNALFSGSLSWTGKVAYVVLNMDVTRATTYQYYDDCSGTNCTTGYRTEGTTEPGAPFIYYLTANVESGKTNDLGYVTVPGWEDGSGIEWNSEASTDADYLEMALGSAHAIVKIDTDYN